MDATLIIWGIIGGAGYALSGYYKNHNQEPFDGEKFAVSIVVSIVLSVIGMLTGYSAIATNWIDQLLIVAPTFAGLTAMVLSVLKGFIK